MFVGLGCESTGPYSASGADMLKGYELAIKHLNENHGLIRSIAEASKPGILGKKISYQNADIRLEPQQRRAGVHALHQFQQGDDDLRLGVVGGGDRVAEACRPRKGDLPGRHLRLQRDDRRRLSALRLPRLPLCLHRRRSTCPGAGQGARATRKVAYLVPDYTYGRTVLDSMKKFTEPKGWKTVTEQLCPLGATDYSSYLLNMMASGADTLVNICFGADAVNSTKQAAQFGALKKMQLVMPYNAPFFANEVGPDIMEGVYGTTEFWWTLEDQNEKAKQFVTEFEKAHKYKPEWGARIAYLQMALYARNVEKAGTFRPVEVIKEYEKGEPVDTMIGKVHWRASDHQLVRPVYIIKGKAKKDMKNKDDLLRHRRDRARRGGDAARGRAGLQAGQLHLIGRGPAERGPLRTRSVGLITVFGLPLGLTRPRPSMVCSRACCSR